MVEIVKFSKPRRPVPPGLIWNRSMDFHIGKIDFLLSDGLPWIFLLIGPPGYGKSSILRALHSKHAPLTVLDPGAGTLRLGLRRLAATLGIDADYWRYSTYVLGREIEHAVSNRKHRAALDGAHFCLLFDECQHASIEFIEEMRGIYDTLGIPMVFAGNRKWGRHLTEEKFEAFNTRAVRMPVDKWHPDDIAAFCAHHRIAGAREQKFLEELAALPGALRNVVDVIRIARALAGPDAAIRLDQLREAARERCVRVSEE